MNLLFYQEKHMSNNDLHNEHLCEKEAREDVDFWMKVCNHVNSRQLGKTLSIQLSHDALENALHTYKEVTGNEYIKNS